MGASQSHISGIVGPPVTLLPFAGYANGTYNPETATGGLDVGANANPAGTIADFSNYRGVVLQVLLQRPQGTESNNVEIIPFHGTTSAHSSHSAFGAGWGWKVNGKDNATPGATQVRSLFIDMDRVNPYLSVEVTVQNADAGVTAALLGIVALPMIPRDASRVDEFTANDIIKLYGSEELTFTDLIGNVI